MNYLEEMTRNIYERQKFLIGINGEPDKRNKAWVLHDKDPRELLVASYGHVISSIERAATLTQMTNSVGKCIDRRLQLRLDEQSIVHVGFFILVAYFESKILRFFCKHQKKKGKRSKFPVYMVGVKNLEALNSIMDMVEEDNVSLFPSKQPLADWGNSFYHEQLKIPFIKNAHVNAITRAKTNDMSYLKSVLNKLQRTGWRINKPVFDAFEACLNSPVSPFKFSKEIDPEKRASLLVEVSAIYKLSIKNIDNPFYHLYNLDFRGRIYPNTAFLHEQSSDNAKGLLLLDEPVKLGKEGSYWLAVHTANVWGNDKVSLDDRVQWVDDNMDDILLYASDPMKYIGWMDAEKPFCFLACCYEWSMLSNWNGDGYAIEDFPSCLPVYIDGSNNGVQHLVAMSKDEGIAPLVNLVPQELPGDVYMFIAEHTMENVQRDLAELDPKLVNMFDEIHPTLVELRKDVAKYVPGTELYTSAKKRLSEFGNSCHDNKSKLGPVFWSKVTDKKIWRKTVKRPTMTLGYGGTQFGMVDMVDTDTEGLSEYLRHKDKSWSAYLGRRIYDTCYEELKGPAALLKMFVKLAEQENEKDTPITFDQIVTGFPFVHSYREPETKVVRLNYQGQRLELRIEVWKEATLKKSKQKTGAAPNIVHSVDAVHLSMFVNDAPYPVTVVHDSFGCHAGNMDKAFHDVRLKFIELYEMDPLEYILSQMDAIHLIPEKGKLNVHEILDSDYAFA